MFILPVKFGILIVPMADYGKPDFWSLKAQKENYPARSVYKLQEIDDKFRLIKPAGNKNEKFCILDLGAAPGSWSLYILRKIKSKVTGHTLTAVDLMPLSAGQNNEFTDNKNFLFIRGDMNDPKIYKQITERGPYNLVMSDAAPATTGNRMLDTLRSLELAESALNYAQKNLIKGGNFIVKVFQGAESGEFFKKLQTLFKTVKSFKPKACRTGSFEIYFLGLASMGD